MKRFYWIRIVLLVAAILSTGCGHTSDSAHPNISEPQRFSASGKVMGTFWNVKTYTDDSSWDGNKLASLVQKTLDSVDASMSTYKMESELSRFNRHRTDEWFDVSSDLARVIGLALEISRQTNGAFDVTVGPLVNMWRFGPNKTALTALPKDEEIAAMRQRVGYDKLQLRLTPTPAIRKTDPELYVDLSAIAKGFAVDRLAEVLLESGLDSFMIDVGGEVKCNGFKPAKDESQRHWMLGIEAPSERRDASSVLHRTVSIDNCSLATSGDYRNYLELDGTRFSHLIDPRSGRPVELLTNSHPLPDERLGSVSVIVESCARADALATAFFVLGQEEGLKLANQLKVAALFISRNAQPGRPTQLREYMSETFREEVQSSLIAH